MAKKKPRTVLEIVEGIDQMLIGSNDAGLAVINRVEKKLDDFIRRTDEAITAILQFQEMHDENKDDKDQMTPSVIVLLPNKKKTKKHLPVLYYQGTLHLPRGVVKYSWTKELDEAAVDSRRIMQQLVDEMDGVEDYPTHYHCPEVDSLHQSQRDDATMVEDDEE